MNARVFDKSKLPSRHVTEGPSRAPHRSYLYAMGLTKEQIHQPLVGVATAWNEAAPCNIALMRQAQSAKKGVDAALITTSGHGETQPVTKLEQCTGKRHKALIKCYAPDRRVFITATLRKPAN